MDHAAGKTHGHHDKRKSLHQRDQDTSKDEKRGEKKAKVDDQVVPSGQALGQEATGGTSRGHHDKRKSLHQRDQDTSKDEKRGKKKAKVDDQVVPSGQEATGGRSRQGRRGGSNNMPNPRSKFGGSGDGMKAHVFEVAEGEDMCVILRTYLAKFTTKRRRGVFVIGGSGTVANVTLLQLAARGDPRTCVMPLGSFSIVSLSGEVLPSADPPTNRGLTVALAGAAGEVISGTLLERGLPAAGPVLVHAVSFHRFETLSQNPQPVQREFSHGQRQNAQPDYGGATYSASPQMGQLPSNSDVIAMSKATASRPP